LGGSVGLGKRMRKKKKKIRKGSKCKSARGKEKGGRV